jgi:hypothetical protein
MPAPRVPGRLTRVLGNKRGGEGARNGGKSRRKNAA